MKTLTCIALASTLLLACGSSNPPPAAPSTDSTTAAAPADPAASGAPASPAAGGGNVSQEGGECSDDVAIQKKCAPGLTCVTDPKKPVSEHTAGTCKKQ